MRGKDNKLTLENTKDASDLHWCFHRRKFAMFSRKNMTITWGDRDVNDINECEIDNFSDLNLDDQSSRGYPTLDWFWKAGHKFEGGDKFIGVSGELFLIEATDGDDFNDADDRNNKKRYVTKTAKFTELELVEMARNEYVSKRVAAVAVSIADHPLHDEVIGRIKSGDITFSSPLTAIEWPTNNRIDAIGQNGNNGEHYTFSVGEKGCEWSCEGTTETPSERTKLIDMKVFSGYSHEEAEAEAAAFKDVFNSMPSGSIKIETIKPIFTQEMKDNGELPPVGTMCRIDGWGDSEWEGKEVKVYSHDVSSNDNVVLAGSEICSGGVTAVEWHIKYLKPIRASLKDTMLSLVRGTLPGESVVEKLLESPILDIKLKGQ